MKKITLLLFIIFPFCVTNVNAQEISKVFRKSVIADNFSTNDKLWKIDYTANELYVIQDGEYVLHRKDKRNPDVIFPDIDHKFGGFHMSADFKFDKSGKGQSAGLVFMAQSGGSGALMIEINDKKEYRLRKLQNNELKNLYYSAHDGWIKSDFLLPGEYNKIEIKSYEKVYDLYFNGSYIRSFSDLEYKEGNVGIYLSADTKVKIDNFIVLEEDILEDIIAENPGLDKADLEDQSLTNVIVSLNAKVKLLEDTINQLNRQLVITKQTTTLDSATQSKINGLEKQVKEQKAELQKLNTQIERTTNELIELRNYKKNVEANGKGDIIDNMSKAINSEKEKNRKKQEEIDALKQENANLKSENRDLKTQLQQLGGGEGEGEE